MTDYNKLSKKIDALTNKNIFNSLVYSVFNKDNVINSYASGISVRNFKKGVDHVYANLDTLFQIDSLMRLVTSIAIMQLNEQGKLSLNKSIKKYCPDFSIKNRYSEGEITIYDLLVNRSGIPSMSYNLLFKNDNNDYHDVLEYLKDQYLICPPKTMEAESDLGYALLGIIIEQVSQTSYEEYVTENIFKPLDIDIKFIHSKEDYENYKEGMNVTYSTLGKVLKEKIKCLIPSRANALMSVNDLMKLLTIFVNDGYYQDKKILNKESVEAMLDEPIYKGEVEGREKHAFGFRFSSNYINSLGKVVVASGNGSYNKVSLMLLKDKGIWCVVAGDSVCNNKKTEEICAEILLLQLGSQNKIASSNSSVNYLQCRVEDYAGFYPSKDRGALIYLGKYFSLKYKNVVYKMRLRQDGYFDLKASSLFHRGDKKLAYFDKNGLLSIVSTKRNGYFEVEDIGYSLKPTTIQRDWKKALGMYRLANLDKNNPCLFTKMELVVDGGYVKMVLIRKGKKKIITLGIVNGREAIALGYGANSNDTIVLNMSNVRYLGMSFNKVKESSVNKTKVKVIDEEKIRRKEHKKKIDKMFDLKK